MGDGCGNDGSVRLPSVFSSAPNVLRTLSEIMRHFSGVLSIMRTLWTVRLVSTLSPLPHDNYTADETATTSLLNLFHKLLFYKTLTTPFPHQYHTITTLLPHR